MFFPLGDHEMEFQFNEGTFVTVANFRGATIELCLTIEEEDQLQSVAEEVLGFLNANCAKLDNAIEASLLETYNSSWSDPTCGRPVLSRDEFLARLTLHTTSVEQYEEDGTTQRSITMYYDDGRLFGGHVVDVFWCVLPNLEEPYVTIAD